ncbi:MAG: cytochrome b/b6 domain-containing protein [Pseudomonadales bacterium]|nr:cytochrome b/b6 domain-containing protein [Pseudomonadales bacterium]
MQSEHTVPVWDLAVRVFHWSLVLFFSLAYVTGEDESNWHIYSGYAVLGLVVFRIVWGLVGSQYARFSNFVYSPGELVQYLRSLREKNPRHYLGHNPAGGWMIVALLASLLVVTLSGLKLYAVEEGKGPFAQLESDINLLDMSRADGDGDQPALGNEQQEEFWEEIHEASVNFTLLLIVLHITGVLVAGRLHHENLIMAMLTGRKKIQNGSDREAP